MDPTLWNWFVIAVDADRSGQIFALELQRALLNGSWSQFNPETCRLMIPFGEFFLKTILKTLSDIYFFENFQKTGFRV